MQKDLDEAKEHYRKLKKLQYNLSLAQNAQYCYGPEYGKYTLEEREELWETVTKHEIKNSVDLEKRTIPSNHRESHSR